MTQPSARVLLDSVSPMGHRVTTMEIKLWRANAVDFVTHRALSRNGASSRAIPMSKYRDTVSDDPVIPRFQANQPGMTPGGNVPNQDMVREDWFAALADMMYWHERFERYGVHKSVTNRLLEPFAWMTYIVTATDWDNFFTQRCSETNPPQHEFYLTACAMRDALAASTPQKLTYDEWHTPLIQPDEVDFYGPLGEDMEEQRRYVSAARCARVSYLTHDGRRDIEKDMELYHRLVRDGHWSPLEHVCTPQSAHDFHERTGKGNLTGWVQLRHMVEDAR